MESTPSSTTVVLEDTDRRERAKERLYVFLQGGGWGLFFAMQAGVTFYFGAHRKTQIDTVVDVATMVMVAGHGLLLTHYARLFMHRWGWKQLGWRQLVPRATAMAFALSAIWNVVGYVYIYDIVGLPWTAKYSMTAVLTIGTVQGGFMLLCWLGCYFFYHLFDRFNRSEIERLRLSAHVKEAELRALKSQVNPHFIFNSLNSLRALIDEDPARARAAVTQLANLLRYSLQSGQLETVPFEDELRVVNDYLALEQVRHEERLRVRMDISPDTLGLPIPPMLVQTLVENAVKYGISARAEGGEIAIIARREAGALRLQVTNPGGIAGETNRRRQASTGVGLRNAAERLRLLFGERATLQLREDAPELVVAEAIVPLNLLPNQT